MIEQKPIAVCPDGSGLAADELKSQLGCIAAHEALCANLRRFIAKHEQTLAGTFWRVNAWQNEIEIWGSYYRAQPIDPKGKARLFPDAKWVVIHRPYTREEQLDYVGELDGVKLVIASAEIIPIYKPSKKGTPLRL